MGRLAVHPEADLGDPHRRRVDDHQDRSVAAGFGPVIGGGCLCGHQPAAGRRVRPDRRGRPGDRRGLDTVGTSRERGAGDRRRHRRAVQGAHHHAEGPDAFEATLPGEVDEGGPSRPHGYLDRADMHARRLRDDLEVHSGDPVRRWVGNRHHIAPRRAHPGHRQVPPGGRVGHGRGNPDTGPGDRPVGDLDP